MTDPSAQARAYIQLIWKRRNIPEGSDVLFKYDDSGPHRDVDPTPAGYAQREREVMDHIIARQLWEIYWSIARTYGKQRRWNSANLVAEMRGSGKILPRLIELFRKLQGT